HHHLQVQTTEMTLSSKLSLVGLAFGIKKLVLI
ncbi:uncharacterized protein Dere_GG26157, partial [Drosophila erecta]